MFEGEALRVFLDNNLWDYLAENQVNLLQYFPESQYELCVTTHGKYEIFQPFRKEKIYVQKYALNALQTIVTEDSVFGFYSSLFPCEYQRSSGFGSGRFSEKNEGIARKRIYDKHGTQKKRKNSQILFQEEADIELAVRSINHPVVTFDAKKKGPLYDAYHEGQKIIFLNRERSLDLSVDEFMNEILRAIHDTKT
jgi:hypothetical protein